MNNYIFQSSDKKLKQFVKFYILKPLGYKIDEIDFGDLFFRLTHVKQNLKLRQFIHITSRKEVGAQIKNTGFGIEMRKSIGEISKEDAESMRGSLSKKFNSYKSPIFYVCKKSP